MFVLKSLEENKWGNLETRKILQNKVMSLCDYLAPRSISIVDTFAAPDGVIGSSFADRNG